MRLCLTALFAVFTACSADLSGIWVGEIPRPNNAPSIDVAFQLVQSGTSLKGKLYGDYSSTAITEGAVDGDTVKFTVVTQEQAGNQINETRLQFIGIVKDGELELTRERISSRNAGNGGDVQVRPNTSKQVFRVKRLL